MIAHVFVVPVTLQPVLRGILLHKIIDSVPEVVGLQQQQLNYEVADLRLIALMATHCLKEEDKSRTHSLCHIYMRCTEKHQDVLIA